MNIRISSCRGNFAKRPLKESVDIFYNYNPGIRGNTVWRLACCAERKLVLLVGICHRVLVESDNRRLKLPCCVDLQLHFNGFEQTKYETKSTKIQLVPNSIHYLSLLGNGRMKKLRRFYSWSRLIETDLTDLQSNNCLQSSLIL